MNYTTPLRPVSNPDAEYWVPGVANSLLGGYFGARATGRGTNALVGATREANALAKYMYDTTRADNASALESRNAGLTEYQNLLREPGSIKADPGYRFAFGQGVNGWASSGSARGLRMSGAQERALTNFGQDYGMSHYGQTLNRRGNLAGLGHSGADSIAQAGQNYAQMAGENLTAAGNAQAAGYIGNANIISGAYTNANRAYQEGGWTQAIIEWLRKQQNGG